MNKETGGPAFPYEYDRDDNFGGTFRATESGMSLRDYFAAKAMHAIGLTFDDNVNADVATMSYKMADAMLEARKK